ncbi:MAG: tetratricopeptide repeat protein, partial [Chloroflexi bacterium]|nr:tetratricopeptide repeat protein [Chloroflexota bacterium]
MMNVAKNNVPLTSVSLALVMVGLLVMLMVAVQLGGPGRPSHVDVSFSQSPRVATNRLISNLQDRMDAQPQNAELLVQIGGVYLQRARETGDLSYYGFKEDALKEALEIDPENSNALTVSGVLALARHRFADALIHATRALVVDDANVEAYGVLGDAQVELGRYDEAFESFQAMIDLKPNLDSYARASYARELSGDVDGAVEAMRLAIDTGRPGTETIAWAKVQLGNLLFNSGRRNDAEQQYEDALDDFPDYFVALTALGRLRFAQGRHQEAIQLLEQSVETIPLPGNLSLLGDFYSQVGDEDGASLQYETVDLIAELASLSGVIYNRELVLFYADHDLKLGLALDLAQAEIVFRKDIYGYDALAWALAKNGRFDEADDAIKSAMKL